MSRNVLILDGKPYFILEKSPGRFYIVDELRARVSSITPYVAEEREDLVLGDNLIETPNRGIALAVETSPTRKYNFTIVEELRKFAQVSFHDYVSYELYGDDSGEVICEDCQKVIFRVRPRLFRKLVDN